MNGVHLLNELTRERARQLARDGIVVFPVGATEQHGPHLPTGTDTFAVEYIARQAAALAATERPVVVAPTLPFGSSDHHLPFGGTMSVGTETYLALLEDLVRSLITGGWTRIVIVNGHGGNHEVVQLVARDLALLHPVGITAFSYWHAAWDALVATGAHEIANVPGHAGHFETALVLALRPELVVEPRPTRDGSHAVDPALYIPPIRIERFGSWQSFDGFTDSPALATAERGTTYLDLIVTAVAETIRTAAGAHV